MVLKVFIENQVHQFDELIGFFNDLIIHCNITNNEDQIFKYDVYIYDSEKEVAEEIYFNYISENFNDFFKSVEKYFNIDISEDKRKYILNSYLKARDKEVNYITNGFSTRRLVKEIVEENFIEINRRVNAIKDSMLSENALMEPAKHWLIKSFKHERTARYWFIASILWLGIAIIGGVIGATWIANKIILPTPTVEAGTIILGMEPKATDATSVANAAKPNQRHDTTLLIALITSYVLVTISIFRFLTRIYRDEQRLADDASQRTTMMNSYLSMLGHKDSPVTSHERALVLQALYRGSALTDGNDDVPAVNIADAIINSIKKDDGK